MRVLPILLAGLAAGPAAGARLVVIEPGAFGFESAVRAPDPGAVNRPGNVLIALDGHDGDPARLSEVDAGGATVWELSLPGGRIDRIRRLPDGTTWMAWSRPRVFSRVLRVDSAGRCLGGFELPEGAAVRALEPRPRERLFLARAGLASEVTRSGRLRRTWEDPGLVSAGPLADGRYAGALREPSRFVVHDPETGASSEIVIESVCQVWDAFGVEEPAPGRLRLYGCFCLPSEEPGAPDGERRTAGALEVDREGKILAAYGSPHAQRIMEFGERTCATFIRRLLDHPDGRVFALDGYAFTCRITEARRLAFETGAWIRGPTTGRVADWGRVGCLMSDAQIVDAPAEGGGT